MADSKAAVDETPQGDVIHPPGYLRHLIFFICCCTMFEGYDVLILGLSLPHIGKEFNAGSDALGYGIGLISIGTMLAFALVSLADRYGRRIIFLTAVSGYTLFTVLTAFSTGLYDFVAWQFIARLFMVTEIGVAAIILTEEMPARFRGMAVTMVFGLALFGGFVGSIIYPYLAASDFGWRSLYLLGGIVLPVLIFYWPRFKETQRWQRTPPQTGTSLFAGYKDLAVIFQPKYRKRLITGVSIWFAVNAWSSAGLYFFAYYVTNERGFDAAQVGSALTLGFMFAVIGYVIASPMVDFAGRRFTVCAFLIIGSLAAVTCFLSQSPMVITVSYAILMSAQSLWGIAATITSEIFPTEVRASGNAVVNNMLGRSGMVLAPAIVGALSVWLGSTGNAVAVVSVAPLLVIPLILMLLSEARGKLLEEVDTG